jgi:hypothetical protein
MAAAGQQLGPGPELQSLQELLAGGAEHE